MSKKYEIDESTIAEMADFHGDNNLVKSVLKKLVPEYFNKNEPFCKIGQLLKREQYPNNFYAVMRMKCLGESHDIVRIVLINNSQIWENWLHINELSRFNNYNEITHGEFAKLCGSQSTKTFSIYKPCP